MVEALLQQAVRPCEGSQSGIRSLARVGQEGTLRLNARPCTGFFPFPPLLLISKKFFYTYGYNYRYSPTTQTVSFETGLLPGLAPKPFIASLDSLSSAPKHPNLPQL